MASQHEASGSTAPKEMEVGESETSKETRTTEGVPTEGVPTEGVPTEGVPTEGVPTEGVLTIRVKDQTGEETFFKVKDGVKMGKLFKAYSARKGVQQTSLRFLLDGERIQTDDTPKSLELEDQDQIDVLLEQFGGR